MKKMYLIVFILLGFAFESSANMQTTGWRWRADDGDEANATWMAEDTVAVTIGANQVVRLRVCYDNPYGEGNDLMVQGLGYALKDTIDKILADYEGTDEFSVTGDNAKWTALAADAYFDFVSSEFVTDQTVTTDQGVVYGSTFADDHQTTWSDGVFMSAYADYTLTHNTYTEIEYCFKPTENCVSGTYYFLGGGGGNIIYPGDSKYEKYPELTVDMSINVANVAKKADIRVFASEGQIQLFSVPEGDVSISLYNLSGSMVKKLETSSTGEIITIPAGNISQGMYIVNIKSAKGNYSEKFILN